MFHIQPVPPGTAVTDIPAYTPGTYNEYLVAYTGVNVWEAKTEELLVVQRTAHGQTTITSGEIDATAAQYFDRLADMRQMVQNHITDHQANIKPDTEPDTAWMTALRSALLTRFPTLTDTFDQINENGTIIGPILDEIEHIHQDHHNTHTITDIIALICFAALERYTDTFQPMHVIERTESES